MNNLRNAATRQQRGAVAVLTALCIVALVGILGFAMDLGMLYVRKTELQNAADAGALGGAREINGTREGLRAARTKAREIAALNASDFGGTPVSIPDGVLNQVVQFGPSPDGAWADADTADPATSWFIKVDTNQLAYGTRPTWFIRVLDNSLATTTANGYAVAGRTLCEGLPIFACALVPATCTPNDPANCGFSKGTTYRLADKGDKEIGPGSIGWMDPVHPDAKGSIIGQSEMRQVICRGRQICLTPGTYTNRTQDALGDIPNAFNTRFGEFKGTLKDMEQFCPADKNVREYRFDDGPEEWMTVPPVDQNAVKWSAVAPQGADRAQIVDGVYPALPKTPYTTTAEDDATNGTDYFREPSGSEARKFAQVDRRMLTIGLATNCGGLTSGDPVEIKAFGRFFLQKLVEKDAPPGSSERFGFFGEFLGLVDTGPELPPDIKLYR